MAALMFGFFDALGYRLQEYNISPDLTAIIPYVITVVVLVLFVGKSRAPAANGKPYVKSK